jgi:hypothetical protein
MGDRDFVRRILPTLHDEVAKATRRKGRPYFD